MKRLTEKQVNKMTREERKNQYDYWVDLGCNHDYIKNPIEAEIISDNENILERKIIHKEF